VIRWITRFGNFVNYEHRVNALLSDGRYVPVPVNRKTVCEVFNVCLKNSTEVKEFLSKISAPIEFPSNAAEYLSSQIGNVLTDLFFRPYTKKMWGLDLEDMAPSVVK
jgi:UDP-galactopyranose mutase